MDYNYKIRRLKEILKEKIKSFFNTTLIQNIIAIFFHSYIWFVYKTSIIIVKGKEKELFEYIKNKKNGLVMFTWHGRVAISPMELNRVLKNSLNKKKYVLSSYSRDGNIVSKIMKKFGIYSVKGSTIDNKKGSKKNKKSLTALRNIIRVLNTGSVCVFAPDGPRGPAFKINTAITDIVKKTNSSIISGSFSYKRKIQFHTWDFFQFPFPFNKIIIEYGNIINPNDYNNETTIINSLLEKELNDNTKNNDILVKKI